MSFYHKVSEKIKDLKFLKQERGAILVLTALLLPIIFGCVGIGYDIGNLYMHKARLQNVADAAALAGGRAFLDSQEKRTDEEYTKDGLAEQEYVIEGGYKTHGSNHIDADRAADDYINHNIRNLGEKVKSDKYSHFALKGLKKSGESYAVADEIFYRVGLSETVPLRFLPLLTNKYEETVRAGAVVLIQPGTPGSNPGGGSGISTIINPSVFDNLFTYSDYLNTRNASDNGTVNLSLTGNIVYTHQNALTDSESTNANQFYEASYAGDSRDEDANNHFYSDKNHGGVTNSAINDAIIDTYYDTKAYLNAFRGKLLLPHVDVKEQSMNLTENKPVNSECNLTYKRGEQTYRKDGNFMYLIGTDDVTTFTEDGVKYKKCYYKMGEKYVLCGKSETDGYSYLLNKNGKISNCYIETSKTSWGDIQETPKVNINGVVHYLGLAWDGFKYGEQYYQANTLTTDKLKDNIELETPVEQNQFVLQPHDTSKTSNIFHISRSIIGVQNFTLNITEEIKGDDVNEPIYIIVDSDMEQFKIEGGGTDTRRPIIVVYYGTGQFQFNFGYGAYQNEPCTFRGTLYAPYAEIRPMNMNHRSQTFYGNVIARGIYKEQGGSTFIQQNFLENNNYTDPDIKAVTESIKQKIEDAVKAGLPEGLKNNLLLEYANALNTTTDNVKLGDSTWYNELTYKDKQKLYQKWRDMYINSDPLVRNFLWPWNEHFDINTGEEQTDPTGETLRLINYRTEYQTKADGSIEEGKVLDPFIFETLGAPNSY